MLRRPRPAAEASVPETYLPEDYPAALDQAAYVLPAGPPVPGAGRPRLVVVRTPPSPAVAAAVGGTEGVTLLEGTSVLRGLHRLWADYGWVRHMGPAVMAEPHEFLVLLRRLADDLYTVLAPGARVVVETAPDLAAWEAMVASLFPDAEVVEAAGLDRALSGGSGAGGADPDPPPASDAVATSAFGDRLIVVVGCARSGTTWLESLLMAHPEVGGVPETETWLFHQLAPLWSELGAGPAAAAAIPALRRFCDELFASALVMHRPGATFFVEKSPVHSYHLDLITAVYPDAWIVHLVRDGRDVAQSMSRVPFLRRGLAGAARFWSDVVDEVDRRSAGLARFRELRYERLCADPVAVSSELLAWAAVPPAPDLEERLARVARTRVSTHGGTGRPVGPGGWRELGAADRARIYAGAGANLVRLGYAARRQVLVAALHPAFLLGRRDRQPA